MTPEQLNALWPELAPSLGLTLEEVAVEEHLARLVRPAPEGSRQLPAHLQVRYTPAFNQPGVVILTLTLNDPETLDGSAKITAEGDGFFASLEQALSDRGIDWVPPEVELVPEPVRGRRSLMIAGIVLGLLVILTFLSFAGVFSRRPVKVSPEEQARLDRAREAATFKPLTPAAPAAPAPTSPTEEAPMSSSNPPLPASPEQAAGTVVKIITPKGEMIVELFDKEAPITAGNFLGLVEDGFYNGLTFHRVEPGFVIQGGDPKGNGTGGPGFTIPDEVKPNLHHELGYLSMAKTSAPNSAGSQFFVCIGPPEAISHLDGTYSVFGRVLKGIEVAKSIAVGDKITKLEVVKKSPNADAALKTAKAARIPGG